MADDRRAAELELWGGIECTVTRVGEDVRDQLRETGHWHRPADLDAIARLNLRAIRYPVLWDHVSPDDPDQVDWQWHDPRLLKLRDLGIRVIAGLVHHGGGPRYVDLLNPEFPERLAVHAARVAERYPWLDHFTPVNEPLTTARFAALYGHWHPHASDDGSFLRALVNQCKAVLLAMRAVRRATPTARLIQTEDLGKCFGTGALAAQAAYENERRWLSFDLLAGRVDPGHPWHRRIRDAGVAARDLDLLRDGEGTPDILGINHYLTSERFLDADQDSYPSHLRSRDSRTAYADVEAVRVDLPAGTIGPEARLREAWERYRLPLAVTEAHHGCTREEQVRWLMEVWGAASRLRAEGVDVRAVTVWSLFGATDWNSLLVRRTGFYEPGPFDARHDPPRPTALATAAAALATTGTFHHPLLDGVGWWRRPERFYRAAPASNPSVPGETGTGVTVRARRLLITGATGTLGHAFSRICDARGLDHILVGRDRMDIADLLSVRSLLDEVRPWAVINTAGFVRVADAEGERARCFRENATGAAVLAEACAERGLPLATFSSDLVFDGRLGRPYFEEDPPRPAGTYGASKAAAESLVAARHPSALVIRTAAFFGPWDVHSFVHSVVRDLTLHGRAKAGMDVVSPTYVPDLVNATLDLVIDEASGLWHMANGGETSWHGLAVAAARLAGLDPGQIEVAHPSRPILRTTLATARGELLPTWEDGLARWVREAGPLADLLSSRIPHRAVV